MLELQQKGIADDGAIIYSVAAVIDLLGFSAHLEIGAHDLRTTIGQAAIARLDNLENSLSMIASERKAISEAYPQSISITRINDALILLLDLPLRLRPRVGDTGREFLSLVETEQFVKVADYLDDDDDDRLSRDFLAVLEGDVQDLLRFVGLVARLHMFINQREAEHHYPGCKTICCSGLRRRFERADGTEDRLAANFAFANAHSADANLHGPGLFVDDNVTRLVCIDRFARNLVRYASFIGRSAPFDLTTDPHEGFYDSGTMSPTVPHELQLFRRQFFFRRFRPAPLTHLQMVDQLRPYLDGTKTPARSLFSRDIARIRTGPDVAKMRNGELDPDIFLAADLTFGLKEYLEFVELGNSPTRDKRTMQEMIAGSTRPGPRSTSP